MSDREFKLEAIEEGKLGFDAGTALRKGVPDELPTNANKKRKVALFVAYVGAGYSGMQYNDGVKTIESTLEAAISRAGGISRDNSGDFYKVSWMRAARTDKGVSAVGQVVSLKMIVGDTDIVARINAELPPEIRVLGFKRVIGSFDARHSCDRRRYEYIIPVTAFDPKAFQTRAQKQTEAAERGAGEAGAAGQQSTTSPALEAHGAAQRADVPALPVRPPAQPGNAGDDPAADSKAAGDLGAPVAIASEPVRRTEGTTLEQAQAHVARPGADSRQENSEIAITTEGTANVKATSVGATEVSKGDHAQLPAEGGAEAPVSAETNAEPHLPATAHTEVPALAEAGLEARAHEAESADAQARAAEGYTFGDVERQRLNGILAQFTGTHNFHNFATRVSATDTNAKRYILEAACQDTFELNGEAWARIVILGQSFMLNQIRKMVGLAVAVMRGAAPPDAVRLALDARRTVDTPIAPATGLFLDESIFACYNERWGADRGAALGLSEFADEVAEFKHAQLYPSIAAQTAAQQTTEQFVHSLDEHAEARFRWAQLPLAELPRRGRHGNGSAVIVNGQESYGVPGARPGRGGKRKAFGSKWTAEQQPGKRAQPDKADG